MALCVDLFLFSLLSLLVILTITNKTPGKLDSKPLYQMQTTHLMVYLIMKINSVFKQESVTAELSFSTMDSSHLLFHTLSPLL